jgi:hypothetical protein
VVGEHQTLGSGCTFVLIPRLWGAELELPPAIYETAAWARRRTGAQEASWQKWILAGERTLSSFKVWCQTWASSACPGASFDVAVA